MKATAKHILWFAIIIALLFSVAMVFSSWFGAKEWRLFGVDAWLVLDRATILSSFMFTAIALHGVLPGGWIRRMFAPRSEAFNQETQAILEDTNVLIMLYHNSDAAMDIVNLFSPRIELLFLVASAPRHGKENPYLTADQFHKWVEEKHRKIKCEAVEIVDDENDFNQAKLAVIRAIEKAEWFVRLGGRVRGKITCDLTGTTKPMTIGMLEAAKQKGVRAVYTTTKRSANDTVVPKTHGLVTVVSRPSTAAS